MPKIDEGQVQVLLDHWAELESSEAACNANRLLEESYSAIICSLHEAFVVPIASDVDPDLEKAEDDSDVQIIDALKTNEAVLSGMLICIYVCTRAWHSGVCLIDFIDRHVCNPCRAKGIASIFNYRLHS